MTDFAEWLNDEMQKRGWNQAELARKADVSRTAISDILSGKYPRVGLQVCSGIARAFDMPVMEVFRSAGLTPPLPVDTPIMKEFRELFTGLPPDEQKKAIRFLQCYAQEGNRNAD